MKKLTIFTPTYNRQHTLYKAYESLINQTNKDFLWLIIDDGSKDNTKEIVNAWKNENKIEIEYYKKENGGKHSAYNCALKLIKTELTLIALDSDDYLTLNAVEDILKCWEENKKNNVYGIVSLCGDSNLQNVYCKYFDSKKLQNCSLKAAYVNQYFLGGAIFTIKTDYLKKFKYPEIKGEKFFTEAYTYLQMDKPFVWLKEIMCIREFREDGLTKNTLKLFINNPKSWTLYNALRANVYKKWIYKIKYTIYALSFARISRINVIEILKNKVLAIVLYPFGIVGELLIKKKGKKYDNK